VQSLGSDVRTAASKPADVHLRLMSDDGGGGGEVGKEALTGRAFERLLAALDPDRERAALAYEALRKRLIGLLRWWGASEPETLADVSLDRVARKLEDGTTIGEGSIGAYVRGVARMVFYEDRRAPRPVTAVAEPAAADRHGEDDAAAACLERCLDTFPDADRTLLLRYYDGGKAAHVRRALAEELQISATALRIRAHRLRTRLERCVTTCLARTGKVPADQSGLPAD
jgi:DNA-directed RNA polymerase specialized sigma24 family protein